MKERIAQWIAFRLPRRLAYWCFVRCSVSTSEGRNYGGNPAERLTGDVLKNLGAWAR